MAPEIVFKLRRLELQNGRFWVQELEIFFYIRPHELFSSDVMILN